MDVVEKADTPGARPEPTYGPLEPEVAHGGTEVAGTIRSRSRKIVQKGEEIPVVDTVRVILTPDGPVQVVSGQEGSVTIYEAGLIAEPGVQDGAKKALRRRAAERKKRKQELEKKSAKTG